MAHSKENLPRPLVHAIPLNSTQPLWWTTVSLGLSLSIAGAFSGWKLFPPNYSASAYLQIESDNRPLIFETADNSFGNGSDFKLYKNTQSQLMKSPFVLNAALLDQKISSLKDITEQDDPLHYLAERLTVSFPEDGEVMQVSMQTLSPTACVEIVNGVVSAYIQDVVSVERNERVRRLSDLERIYSDSEERIRKKRHELRQLSEALGTSESDLPPVMQQSVLLRYEYLTQKLIEIQFERMQAVGEMKIAREFDRRQKEADMPPEPTDASQPLDESMTKEEDGATPSVAGRSADVVQVEDGIGAAKSVRLEVLANQEKLLQEQVDQLATEIRQMDRVSIDLELKRSEISVADDVLRSVGREIERSSIELKSNSRIKLLSAAATSSPRDLSKRWIAALGLGMFGFVVPFGLFATLDLVRKRSRNENL